MAQKITDVAFVGDPEDDALGYAEREIYALGEESERSALREIQPSVVEAISRMEEMYRDPTAGKGILSKDSCGGEPSGAAWSPERAIC